MEVLQPLQRLNEAAAALRSGRGLDLRLQAAVGVLVPDVAERGGVLLDGGERAVWVGAPATAALAAAAGTRLADAVVSPDGTALAVPLGTDGAPAGRLLLERSMGLPFDDAAVELVQAVADRIAVALRAEPDAAERRQAQLLVERSPIGVAVLRAGEDGRLRFEVVNSALCELLGLPRAGLVGRTPEALHPVADRERVGDDRVRLAVVERGAFENLEFDIAYRRPDGRELPLRMRFTALTTSARGCESCIAHVTVRPPAGPGIPAGGARAITPQEVVTCIDTLIAAGLRPVVAYIAAEHEEDAPELRRRVGLASATELHDPDVIAWTDPGTVLVVVAAPPLAEAQERFDRFVELLAAAPRPRTVIGLAEHDGDDAVALLSRAERRLVRRGPG